MLPSCLTIVMNNTISLKAIALDTNKTPSSYSHSVSEVNGVVCRHDGQAAPAQVDQLYNYVAASCEVFSMHLAERDRHAKKLEIQLQVSPETPG